MATSLKHWVRYTARTVSTLWGGWWTFFGLASGIGEGLEPLGILIHTLIPGLVFLASAAIAWRWGRVGGVVLILEGLFTLVYFPFAMTAPGFLTLSLPAIAAGILFAVEQYIGLYGAPPPAS